MQEIFKIRRNYKDEWEINIGTGKWFEAKSLNEVRNAISHYFGLDRGNHTGRLKRSCPLCRSE